MMNWYCKNCQVENSPARSTCWKCKETKNKVAVKREDVETSSHLNSLNTINIHEDPTNKIPRQSSSPKGNYNDGLVKQEKIIKPIYPIMSKESPRELLAKHFKDRCGELPIRGGWGYSKDDACIIDKYDPIVDPNLPFDGIGIEYTFVKKRTYEELIIFREKGERFSGINWKLISQELVSDNDRYYDKLVFEITAFHEDVVDKLKAEFEGPSGYGKPNFDAIAHEKKRQEKILSLTREFWFDITSFYGQKIFISVPPSIWQKERSQLRGNEDNDFNWAYKNRVMDDSWYCNNCQAENGPARITCWKCKNTNEIVKEKETPENTSSIETIHSDEDNITKMSSSNKMKLFAIISKYFFFGIIALMLIMLLYPPYKFVWEGYIINKGNHFILSPPDELSHVNIELLFMQWLIVVTVGAIGAYVLKNKK